MADDARAHAVAHAQKEALQRARAVPVRPWLGTYNITKTNIAPLAPSCDAPPPHAAPLCAWLAFDERRMNMPGNYYASSAPQAQAHFNHMKTYEPDAAFRAWDDERSLRAAHAIATDPYIRAHYLRIVAQSDYRDDAHAREQAGIKQELLQRTADHIRAAYDLPSIPVVLVRMPPGSMINGSYLPIAPVIEINYDIYHGLTDSYAAMLGTLAHEVRHSIDADFVEKILRGEMQRTDVRAGYAAATALNMKEYFSYRDSDKISSGHWFYDAYSLQPVERHAYEYGDRLATRILNAMYCDSLSRAHLCALYGAQQRLLP